MTRKRPSELRREVEELRAEVARLRLELAMRSAPQYIPYPVPYQPPLYPWQNPVIAGPGLNEMPPLPSVWSGVQFSPNANACAPGVQVTIYDTTGAAPQPFQFDITGPSANAAAVSIIPFSGGAIP